MKKVLALLTAVTMVLGTGGVLPNPVLSFSSLISASASTVANGSCGNNVTWILDDVGTLTINGTGEMDDWTNGPSIPWYSFQEKIKTVMINYGVTYIGDRAFQNCVNLVSVSIPDSVTEIHGDAFLSCTSLTTITIPQSVTTFSDVHHYPTRLFCNCVSLKEINVSSSNQYFTSIDGVLFDKSQSTLVSYPQGKESLEYSVPSGVKTIENGAFYSCNYLNHVIIPDTVTQIGGYSFYKCNQLNEIDIPDSVLEIGVYAFNYCTNLQNVYLPASLKILGDRDNNNIFDNCDSLRNIGVSKDNPYYASVNGVLFDKSKSKLITYPSGRTDLKYLIPDGVTIVGTDAFSSSHYISEIVIPNSVTTLEKHAFSLCVNLDNIVLPASIIEIPDGLFSRCTSLSNITILGNITSIGDWSFMETSIKSITIPESCIRIDTLAFYQSSLKEIYILNPSCYLQSHFNLIPPSAIIYGYDSSTAQTYANEYNRSFVDLNKIVNISNCTITLGTTSYTYDSTVKQPTVTVKDGSKTLTSGTDYTVSYSNNVNVGTATVTITGKGSYTGTASKTFTINAKSISGMTITLSQSSYTYDGNAKKPMVMVKDGSKTLTSGTDYTVSYSNNVNVGMATVMVTGKGNYTGSKSVNFTITEKPKTDVSKCTVTLGTTSYTYDGTAKKPSVTVKNGTTALTNGTDYTVSYSSNTNAGTAKATITGKGNYTGTASKTFTINAKSVSGMTVTLNQSSYTYDGNAKKPTVTVKDGTKTLVNGTDYSVAYSNNVNVGTATVTITGKGNYTGTATKDFTITAKSLSSAAVTLSQTSYTYDGNAKKPTVTVKDGSKTLTSGTDYTVSYSNNVNVGTATVTVTGKGNYTGSKSVNFTITEKPKTDVSKCTVTLGTTSYTYDGTAKKPSVTVKNGTTALTNGTDYTVSYSSNTNAGTAKATITGKGNYTGTASKTFTINAKFISGMTITLSQSSYTYDGNAKKPTATVKDGSKTLTSGTDYTVSYSNNVNVGTATVTITGKGNYTGTATKDFTITAKSLSSAAVKLSQTSYTYDGNAKKPTVTVKDGSKTLTSGTDYTVSYSNNVNVGTATVMVTGKGNYTGSKSVNFTITEKPKTDVSKCTVTLGTTSYTYDGTAKKPSVTVKNGTTALTNGTDYTVSYSSNTNAGTAKATITGKGNYTGTASKTFTINAKSISRMTITLSQSSYTYDGNAKKPTVTVKDGTKTLVNGTDYSVAYSNNVNVGTAKATVTGKGNYTGSVTKTFTIKAKPVEKKKFIEGGDNWCFSNSGSNFGSTYYMSDKYWNALLKGLSNTEKANMKKYVKKAEWGGSCYGMATTSILASNGILKPGTYQKGANFLHDISKPPSKEVKSLINYYFALQYTDVIQQQICNNFYSDDEKAKLQSLLKCLEDGSPTLLCFHGYFYGFSWGGHAVVAYDVEYGSYSYNKKAYNGKILIYDNNSVNYNDDYCLYFNSSNGSWTIPYYGLDSSDGSILGLITDDLKYINYHGYLNGSSNVKVNDYIAVLHSAALSGNYKLTKAALSNGIWTATSASDDDIKVFSSFVDTDFSKSDLMFAMKDASSGYIMKTSNTEKLDLTLSYENSLLVAEANKGKQAKFSPEGCIEVNGEKTDYTLGMTFNSDYPTDWYSVQVSGSNANNASLKKANNGWIVSSDHLDCVIVNASNDDVEAKTTFSTKYPSALIYEIDKNTIGIKVDTDNNGTYETAINGGSETKAISKLSISLSSSSYVYDGSAKKPTITVKDGSKALVNGTDYTVSYSNNTAAGTAKVTITGKGKYTGSVTKTFTITRASLAKAKITGLSNKTYTGKAIKQTPVVKLGSKTLKAGTDYTVSYKNNKAVGTATVTITGKGAYTGTAKATFKINPKKTTLKSVTSPKTKQLKATYSKVSGVTGYQVSYSTSSKFTKTTTKTASSTKTSKTISKLTKGKTYYVRVRTYKTVNKVKYYSGWSAVKKIKVK